MNKEKRAGARIGKIKPRSTVDGEEHRRFLLEHFRIKGREAAEACLSLIATRRTLASVA